MELISSNVDRRKVLDQNPTCQLGLELFLGLLYFPTKYDGNIYYDSVLTPLNTLVKHLHKSPAHSHFPAPSPPPPTRVLRLHQKVWGEKVALEKISIPSSYVLFGEAVPPNCILFGGIFLLSYILFGRTVPPCYISMFHQIHQN